MSLLTPHKFASLSLWLAMLGLAGSGTLLPQPAQASVVVKLARLVLTGKTGAEPAGTANPTGTAAPKSGVNPAPSRSSEHSAGVSIDAMQAKSTGSQASRSAG